MRLSCLPVSLYPDLAAGRLTPGDWLRRAAALGLDGADLSVAHVPSRAPVVLDRLRTEAADAGIAIAILAAYPDFTHPNSAERRRQEDELRAWIDAAARLGAGLVRVTAGQAHPGVREADGLAWAAAGLTSCLDHASAAGVRLIYENHVRGAGWTLNDFTQPAARFLDVVRRTDGSGLAILFDTANNLALDEDPLEVLEAVRHRLGAVHLSDLRQRGTFEPVLIGTGVAPLEPLLRRVVEIGFNGWLSIEEASRTGDDAFRAAAETADRLWAAAGGHRRATAGSSSPPSTAATRTTPG
jgi:sugar phosphate isomerase/epimerase